MVDRVQHPTIMQKVAGQLHLLSYDSFRQPALYQRHSFGKYSNAAFQYPMMPAFTATSSIFEAAPAEKVSFLFKGNFLGNFLIGGVSAAVSKTAALPFEPLIFACRYEEELVKAGRLPKMQGDPPLFNIYREYLKGIMQGESVVSILKSNILNILYF